MNDGYVQYYGGLIHTACELLAVLHAELSLAFADATGGCVFLLEVRRSHAHKQACSSISRAVSCVSISICLFTAPTAGLTLPLTIRSKHSESNQS
jgi:hypothetical protein